jgi:nucleoside-diphosphate-sugar epimerase
VSPPTVVLVTGSSGFFGTALCRAWRARGIVIRAFRRPGGGVLLDADEVFPLADPFDRPAVRTAMAGADTVVHLAARVHQLREAAEDPLAAHRRVNVDWTRLLGEEAAESGVRRFVFTSSIKAAGESNTAPWTEGTPPRPVDPYGISKLEAEAVLREIAVRSGMLVPVLRMPLCYGPGVKANMLRLFDAVWHRWPLPLGQVENRRSFLYVGNGVAAIDAVIAAGAPASRVFYVSDGRDLSTPELVRLVGQALSVSPRLVPVPPWLFRLAGKAGEVVARVIPCPLNTAAVDRLLGSLTVDVSALREVTGWEPPYSVEAGLADTARWYLERRHHPQETR